MGLFARLWYFGGGRGARRPGESGSLIVRHPCEGELWRVGEERTVTWKLAGRYAHPVDVDLVADRGRSPKVVRLATALDPRVLGGRITVPTVPADTYRIVVASQNASTSSRSFRIQSPEQ
ncbi:hypothetical protein [Streptomyces sp. N35]|uniref:hypothetical protein n=1 Tax=Streptomyces sp. N35 TaxID=2795730 RepID=UPI0018F4AB62|nr:hypothetical protein [Streptomyces sp. N35]